MRQHRRAEIATRAVTNVVRVEPALPTTAPASLSTPQDIAEMDELLAGEVAPNTRVAYHSDIAHFRAWCNARGAAHLPATPEAVALYFKDLAFGHGPRVAHAGRQPRARHGGWSLATIERHHSSIARIHLANHLPDPTRDEDVRRTMRAIRRRLGVMQRQVSPLLPEHIAAALAAMPEPRSTLDTRDAAAGLFIFSIAGRRSEPAALDVADVVFTPRGMEVNLGPSEAQPDRRTKTNQAGEHETVAVVAGKNPATDPVRALRAWLEIRGIEPGPLFFGVTKQGKIRRKRMPAKRFALIAKRFAELAGLDPRKFSGHSWRAGFVTAADARGVQPTTIAQQTRHKRLDTLKRYMRHRDKYKNNAGEGLL